MKRVLLTVAIALVAGCDSNVESAKLATPDPAEAAEAARKATPKPGDWLFKDYKNPLNQAPAGAPAKPSANGGVGGKQPPHH